MSFKKCHCGAYAFSYDGTIEGHRTLVKCPGTNTEGYPISSQEGSMMCRCCSKTVPINENSKAEEHQVFQQCQG